jgi:NADH dehydrogenase
MGRLRFGGFLAWCAWLALHITVLIGFRNRASVLLSWIYSYFFYGRGSRLITNFSSEQMAELSADTMKGAGGSVPSAESSAAAAPKSAPAIGRPGADAPQEATPRPGSP